MLLAKVLPRELLSVFSSGVFSLSEEALVMTRVSTSAYTVECFQSMVGYLFSVFCFFHLSKGGIRSISGEAVKEKKNTTKKPQRFK